MTEKNSKYGPEANSDQTSEKNHRHIESTPKTESIPTPNLDLIRSSIEHHSKSRNEYHIPQPEQKETHQSAHLTYKLKNHQFKTTLKYTQASLKPAEREFSKFIHSKNIDNISEICAKTIVRPIGILSGSALAIIGYFSVFVVAHTIGFRVPNSLFLYLFVAGYILGLLIDMVQLLAKKQNI